MDGIVQLISTVGFPIAACIALFWQNNKLSEAINTNTAALVDLKHMLEVQGRG